MQRNDPRSHEPIEWTVTGRSSRGGWCARRDVVARGGTCADANQQRQVLVANDELLGVALDHAAAVGVAPGQAAERLDLPTIRLIGISIPTIPPSICRR